MTYKYKDSAQNFIWSGLFLGLKRPCLDWEHGLLVSHPIQFIVKGKISMREKNGTQFVRPIRLKFIWSNILFPICQTEPTKMWSIISFFICQTEPTKMWRNIYFLFVKQSRLKCEGTYWFLFVKPNKLKVLRDKTVFCQGDLNLCEFYFFNLSFILKFLRDKLDFFLIKLFWLKFSLGQSD